MLTNYNIKLSEFSSGEEQPPAVTEIAKGLVT